MKGATIRWIMRKEFIEGSGGIMDGGVGEGGSISSTAHVRETKNVVKSKLNFFKSKLE